jgi:hypothetical protein
MDTMKFTSRIWRRRRRSRSAPEETQRRDTHVTPEQAVLRIGIDAQMPNSMPRAEDDAATRAGSPEFHDRPGSGRHIANRQLEF